MSKFQRVGDRSARASCLMNAAFFSGANAFYLRSGLPGMLQ
ncbi:Hypothetical protein ABZS17D1_00853 [Kosakonia cowanii]